MSEEFGSDFITLLDEEGKEIVLEVITSLDYQGETYYAFLPADMDVDDPDYGMVILHEVAGENGDMEFEDPDDDDVLNAVYELVMAELFADEDEEE